MKYYYVNANSIWIKRTQYLTLLSQCQYDVISVCETKLDAVKPNGVICDKNYVLHRKDRDSRGGGVALFVKRELKTSVVTIDSQFSNLEILAVDFAGSTPFRVITVYRPPNCSGETTNEIWKCIGTLTTSGKPSIVLGDFNMSEIVWFPSLHYVNSEINANFLSKMNKLGLQQYVAKPTRKNYKTNKENFLDLVFCTDDAFIFDVQVVSPIVHSDHSAVTFTSKGPNNLNAKSETEDDKYFDFSSADWESINDYLSGMNWDNKFVNGITSENYWNAFLNVINCAIETFVPSKKSKLNVKKTTHPKFLNDMIKKKNALYHQRECPAKRAEYNKLNEKIRKITIKNAKNRENKILSSADPNRLFNYIRKRRCNDNGVGPLKDKDGKLSTDETEKSNILNNCFVKNFTADNGKIPVFGSRVSENVFLKDYLDFTPLKVRQCLAKISHKKSRTPDGIPATFYKMTADQISYPLSVIFNISFNSGELPKIWKVADVVPLYKKGDSSDPSNYRPVSLTCIACKIMEMCIADEMLNYLRASKLLTKQQHGFLSRRSTCTQLLECFEDWTSNLENKDPTDVIYVDFKKAFDSVSHEKLLAKLEAYGFKGKVLKWIKSFLLGRCQRVCLGLSNSEYAPVTSGVPQGSVLGPLLFLIFVNDLPEQFEDVICKLFADDLKLYQVVRLFENLKKALKILGEWADKWQLNIAVPKCNALHIANKDEKCDYTIQGNTLPSESSVRDLGVYVSDDLKVSNHCMQITQKANKITNMIFNCFETDSLQHLLDSYKIYVRPILEYCTPVWNPYLIKDITLIEKVQKYFTRRLFYRCGLNKLPYPERLKFLGLESLEKRRLHYDLCMVYNILHNENDLKATDFFTLAPKSNTHKTCEHHMKLFKKASHGNIRANFFSQRVVSIWNSIPKFLPGTIEPIVNSMNIKLFKTRISQLDFSKFLNYD